MFLELRRHMTLLTNVQKVFVARKELKEKQSGTNERVILDLLETLRHPNIVQFLGSYTQHGMENLLFPYVSMDLTQLFKSEREIDAHDLYLGMHGITDALSKIHDFSFKDRNLDFSRIGYHHDLRPSNILVQGKVFLIADFGLSKLKADDQDSKSLLKGGHDDYLGPESFNPSNYKNGLVGRALDVWSFGCILAEMVTFIERRSIAEFRAKREETYGSDIIITDSAFHLEGEVRPAVTEWLSFLTLQPSDPQVSRLVTLVYNMLNPNPYRRMKITAVTEKLALLTTHSKMHAINLHFREISPLNGTGTHQFAAQVFLEHKRFKSWEAVFDSLHKDQQFTEFDGLITSLSNLLDALATIKHGYPDPNELEQPSNDIISRICDAIDSLCTGLSSDGQRKVQDLWTRTVCQVQDAELLEAIRLLANLNRYRLVGVSVAMRYMSQVITKSISLGSRSRYIDPGCIDIDECSPTNFHGARSLHLIEDRARTMGHMHGDSGSNRVMIEWKEYDTRWQGDRGDKLFSTMDALVNLLDPNVTLREGVAKQRVLACCGYFHEPHNYRFGFVYNLFPLTSINFGLFSVNNVIRMTDPDEPELVDTIRPNLGDIFTLAKDLSLCLHVFHNAGWVHKNISSHHLLIFSPSPQVVHEHVVSAVLAGFNDSRPEASGYTLGPRKEFLHYQHPLYQTDVEFRKSFDYFGLGMILLELGLWRPASVLRSYHPEISSAEDFRIKLLTSYVPQLGEKMGAVYRDAVAFCLDSESLIRPEEQDVNISQDMQSLFESRVVKRLSLCIA